MRSASLWWSEMGKSGGEPSATGVALSRREPSRSSPSGRFRVVAMWLILATWIAWVVATLGNGLLFGRVLRIRLDRRLQLQSSLWVGLTILVLAVLMLNLVVGLRSITGGLFSGTWLVVGWISVVVFMARSRRLIPEVFQRVVSISNLPALGSSVVIVIIVIGAARFASGEPMDADAGIYRMGLINYAAEFRVIPGLANLHDRFGFNSSVWPMAAVLENGFWVGNGFRVVTGFFFSFLALDALLRTLVPRERRPGDYFTLIAMAFATWMILNDSGRWMPSPAQDLVGFVLFSAAIAYLLDSVSVEEHKWELGFVAVSAAVLAATARPLGWLLVVVVPVVVAASGRKLLPRKGLGNARRWALAAVTISVLAFSVMALRDAVLSGWILFPLSALPLPVDWLSPAPVLTSEWITAYARDPSGLASDVLGGNEWFAPWLSESRSSREFQFLFVAVVSALAPLAWRRGRAAWQSSWRSIGLAEVAAVATAAAWFYSAPALRFGWGPVLALAAIPISALLAARAYSKRAVISCAGLLLVLGIAINYRLETFDVRGGDPSDSDFSLLGFPVKLKLAGPPTFGLREGSLADGTPVIYAENGGCYNIFPLCLLPDSGQFVEMRGESIQEGFRTQCDHC